MSLIHCHQLPTKQKAGNLRTNFETCLLIKMHYQIIPNVFTRIALHFQWNIFSCLQAFTCLYIALSFTWIIIDFSTIDIWKILLPQLILKNIVFYCSAITQGRKKLMGCGWVGYIIFFYVYSENKIFMLYQLDQPFVNAEIRKLHIVKHQLIMACFTEYLPCG